VSSSSSSPPSRFAPKPPWLKVRAPGGETYVHLKETFRELDLHTVCEEARCPNVGECWTEGTATVMLLGSVCTRGCRFCAVTTGNPRGAVDGREPEHVARAIARLGLQYVVMTMVDRDDLLDGGAAHVARTVTRLRELRPDILIETLLGDFGGHLDYVDVTVDAAPHVWAHNIEVVERLQRTIRDVRCSYERSLAVLERVKQRDPGRVTKSSIMVGIGEQDDEVLQTLADLRKSGVDLVTLGQYLRPASSPPRRSRCMPSRRARWASRTWRAARWCAARTRRPRCSCAASCARATPPRRTCSSRSASRRPSAPPPRSTETPRRAPRASSRRGRRRRCSPSRACCGGPREIVPHRVRRRDRGAARGERRRLVP
jgi:lipoic acid synthetase